MPRAFRDDLGYNTAIIGKNHFGFNKTSGKAMGHGYDHEEMYDMHPKSEYKDWFHTKEPGKNYFPSGTDYNTWWAKPFEYRYDYHSTGWTGMRTVEYIKHYNFDKPLFLKSSFFAPHSPYDCP
jgi:arylsulfatase A-like enzyme